MNNFDLWTKQNIIDIIFHFNEKNYELLRSFIKWYNIKNNYTYILSTRYFYSNECLKLLLRTINAFIDVKNNDISEEYVVNELEKEINLSEEVVVNELEKEINLSEEVVFNELEKKNDSDEYVINDDYYFAKDIVKKEEEVEEVDEEGEDKEEVEGEDKEEVEGEDKEEVEGEDREEVEGEDREEVEGEDEANNNLIINKFSNNEIILLLNILEEDTKKFRKHNYIIAKFKEKLFFYNNFYLGFTSGLLFYFFFKFL